MKRLLLLTAALATLHASADKIGEWKAYMAYSDITDIEPAGNMIFVLSSNSIFSYNVNDESITTYDKVNSLSDCTVTDIAWNTSARRLIIIYDNYNIDLLDKDGSVHNIPDYYSKVMTEDKTVNNIMTHGNYAYICTAFGIVKLNMSGAEITDTYNLGRNVSDCTISGNHIYAMTDGGLYKADMSANLLDPANWTHSTDNVPFTDSNDISFTTANGYNERYVYDSQNKCYWSNQSDGRLQSYTVNDDNTRTVTRSGIAPEGPASNNFYRIYLNDGKLYGVGGLWNEANDRGLTGEVHVWDGEEWAEFEKVSDAQIGHNYIDLLCLDFDPKKPGHVMVGAKSGLYEFQDMKFVKSYNNDNSPLQSAGTSSSGNYTIVSSVKYDNDGNLWVFNTLSDKGIKKLSPSGEWSSYGHPELTEGYNYDLQKVFISPTNGKMWFVNSKYNTSRLFSYNYTNDILTAYGPTITNQDGTSLGTARMFGTTEDKEGNVWLATEAGPVYLTPEAIQSGSTTFTQYKVPRNDGTNYADYLLTGIDIRAIAVDGGNRKWIGTSGNGVFLISSDNNTQIEHFTAADSPLISDIIQDILIDGTTGRVFLATDKGLCSYMSDATEPAGSMDKDNVYAYPNPVKPDYTGLITITGLAYNADVKIVTSNGTLVNKGTSTGGTYTWDGCDLKGRRVASGVYMVMTATESGKKGAVCKIAVVN